MTSASTTARSALLGSLAAGALALAMSAPATAAPQQADSAGTLAAPCVEKVAVVNNGGFTIKFAVSTREGSLTPGTDVYPINQSRTIDLTATDLTEGVDVRPIVEATAGDTVPGNTFVSYCANGQTATYTASGTTLDYTVTLIG
ncbi:hypothetical protein [Umezawaea tangerina]|uniref:Uncharacterized protein n=1 Tax=Umezawaea tangerina TaxID=84725 RepID=A0A2T0TGW9_9PSEU|nr:hypothetical protein [Umezawaea tangerina]PRY44869.1 hypothetical protein CLV43_102434 [Umezawaea tangerina]